MRSAARGASNSTSDAACFQTKECASSYSAASHDDLDCGEASPLSISCGGDDICECPAGKDPATASPGHIAKHAGEPKEHTENLAKQRPPGNQKMIEDELKRQKSAHDRNRQNYQSGDGVAG